MAGGVGSRFWPLSREKRPKQFIDILGTGKSLIQQTYSRFEKIIPKENIFIVTNKIYKEQIKEQLPDISEKQILSEPQRKNTAPCIAFSNKIISEINPDANIIVAPSDHVILEEEKFLKIVNTGFDFVSKNESLLTLGITANRPETGYGYIQVSNVSDKEYPDIKKVKTFTEKPDTKTAEVFIKSGEFFWNAGIFLWSLKSINKAFEKYLPEMNNLFFLNKNKKASQSLIDDAFLKCRSISIDNGIMERAENVHVLCDDFGWSDLGTWDALFQKSNKNKNGNVANTQNIMCYETENSIIKVPENKLVVIQGLKDYLVVDSGDILLICKKNDENKIRQFVNDVKVEKGNDFI